MENSKKRERASNFNKNEIRLLTELATKYKHILENKKTDAVTNKEKENAWIRIASMFNSSTSDVVRSAKTLKLKYEGLKKATKKKMTCHRQELYRTGGGPSNAPDIDDVDDKILSICSNITGLEARNDCDDIADLPKPTEILSQNGPDNKIIPDSDGIIQIIDSERETVDILDHDADTNATAGSINLTDENEEGSHSNKWKSWNPKALKSKVSSVLKPTKSSVTAKLDQLSAARLELVLLQQDIAKKEHSFVEEEHKLKIIHLKNEESRKLELHNLMLTIMQQKNDN